MNKIRKKEMLPILKLLKVLAAIIGNMVVIIMGFEGITLLFLLKSSNYQEDFWAIFRGSCLPLIVVGGISFTAVYSMRKIINKKEVLTSRSRLPRTKLSIAIILGCISGIAVNFVWPDLPIGSWSRYEQLPSKALHFLGHDENELFGIGVGVYIEAVDGTIYRCQNLDLPCVASPEFTPSVPYQNCGSPNGITPWAPGKVIDKLSYRFCGIDVFWDNYYIILESGSVWKWSSHGSAAYGFYFNLFFWMLVGAVTGVLIWLPSNIFTKR